MKYSTSGFGMEAGWSAVDHGGLVFDVGSLYSHFEKLRDKRKRRGIRYQLADALTLLVLAKLGGEDEVRGMADWLKHRSKLLAEAMHLKRSSMPHQTTISRILGEAIDVEEMEQVLRRFFDHRAQGSAETVISLDGKTLRGTIEVGQTQGLHLLAAYLPQEGIVLMQVEVECKENEIVVAPKLLKTLDLRGKVVIGDAMHTQRQLSIQIVNQGGDYLWTAKLNQPDLYQAIHHLFEPEVLTPGFGPTPTDFQTATTCDKGHGRIDTRTITTSALLKDYLDWPYLQQVFKIERHAVCLTTGEVTEQISYGLTSLSPERASPQQLLKLKRSYWGIENGLHYRRDVTFYEDRCRLRRGKAPRLMAILNNLVLGLLSQLDFHTFPDARRKFSASPLDALPLITQPHF